MSMNAMAAYALNRYAAEIQQMALKPVDPSQIDASLLEKPIEQRPADRPNNVQQDGGHSEKQPQVGNSAANNSNNLPKISIPEIPQ